MLKNLLIFSVSFLLLISEGIALDLLPASLTSSDTLIVPHWVLMFLILIAVLYDTDETFFSIIYGIVFGLLIDIVYTDVLGVYMFVYPFALYIAHLLKRLLQTNIHMTILIATISMIVVEVLLLFIYSVVGIVETTATSFIVKRLLPTLLANILFLIPLYLFSVNILRSWNKEQSEKK